MVTGFAAETAVRARGDGTWEATVTDRWDVVRGAPNGGYLLAVAARAMREAAAGGDGVVGHPDPASITAHYLRPPAPGPVEVTCEVLKRGRRLTTVRATMAQDGRACMALLGSFADLDAADGPTRVERTPPALPAADACERMFRHPDDTGYVPPIFDRVDIRAPARMSGWQHGEPLGRGEMAGWMRLDGEAQVDTLGLLVLADALPPAVFNAGDPVGWVPTIELTVQVRAAPAAGWLSSRFTTERITRGFLEEDGEVFDADGRLVVLSRQLALTARGRST